MQISQRTSRSLEAAQNHLNAEENMYATRGLRICMPAHSMGITSPSRPPCLFPVLNEYSDDDRHRSRVYKSFAYPGGVTHTLSTLNADTLAASSDRLEGTKCDPQTDIRFQRRNNSSSVRTPKKAAVPTIEQHVCSQSPGGIEATHRSGTDREWRSSAAYPHLRKQF